MEYSKKIRGRIRILLLVSNLSVALVFGLSFYFSLVSAESALANMVPELAELAERFKSTLTLNTLAFAGIIIGSFAALALLVTKRLFKPLEAIEKGLDMLASGRVPPAPQYSAGGPFDTLRESYISAREQIEKREQSDISTLEECLMDMEKGIDVTESLRNLIEEKNRYSGKKDPQEEKGNKGSSEDPIFMQPA